MVMELHTVSVDDFVLALCRLVGTINGNDTIRDRVYCTLGNCNFSNAESAVLDGVPESEFVRKFT